MCSGDKISGRPGATASAGAGPAAPSLPARAGIAAIRLYQLTLSPFVGGSCRYLPTCSAYGTEAIGRFGLWAGGWMTLARFLRCNPLGASGFDPVPDGLPAAARWWTPWRYGRWTGRHIDPATRLDG
jgi:putative membrane protein insertion efficiency factor